MILCVSNMFQTALGLILGAAMAIMPNTQVTTYNGLPVVLNSPVQLQLGGVIMAMPRDVAHEYGHYEEWQQVGGLYPLVIALPSLAWNIGFSIFSYTRYLFDGKVPYTQLINEYRSFFTEHWADQLGGVQR